MSDDDSDDFTSPPTRKKRKIENGKPLILVASTPLMARVYEMIQQSAEMIFVIPHHAWRNTIVLSSIYPLVVQLVDYH